MLMALVAPQRAAVVLPDERWVLPAVLIFTVVLLAIDPPWYFGGHWDDGRYLEAALAWTQGPQVGTVHWALRWPVVLPAMAVIDLYGVTRTALMLPSLAYFFVLVMLNFCAARCVFGTTVAGIAVMALITTAAVFESATRLGADLPELTFITVSAWCLVFARRNDGPRQWRWLFVSGIVAGLAWATRETALTLFLSYAAVVFITPGMPRLRYLWLAAGFTLVFLPEQLALWSATGDPMYRLHVDLRHIEVPSYHLAGLTAHGLSGPLNPALMARWAGTGPLHIYWAIDPWLNLFLNPEYGIVFALLVALTLLRTITRLRSAPACGWRLIGWLALFASINVVTITYIVATDPKPRMFMPAIAAGCLCLGLLAANLPVFWRATGFGLLFFKVLIVLVVMDMSVPINGQFPALAAQSVSLVPGTIHVDRWTMSSLALADAGVRDRLSLDVAAPGDVLLVTGHRVATKGDETALPPQRGQWQQLSVRASDPRSMLQRLRLIDRHADPVAAKSIHDKAPVAILYRRLPDQPPSPR